MAATVPQAYLRSLSDAINRLSGNARAIAQGVIRDVIASSGTDNPFDIVDELSDALEPIFEALTNGTASLSASSYDLLRLAAVGDSLGASPYPNRDKEWTRTAMYGIAKDHIGNMDAFAEAVLSRLDYEARRAAGSTTIRNATEDPGRPRYARVPTGPETCPFCIMLASRGAVYHTERSAGRFDHYHPNCDCRVVPVFDYITVGYGPDTRRIPAIEIEGYDPDEYYDQYIDDIASGALNLSPRSGGRSAQRSVPTKLLVRDWGGYPGVKDYFSRAKDIIDLDERYQEVMGSFKQSDYPEDARGDLQKVVQELVIIAKHALADVKKRQ